MKKILASLLILAMISFGNSVALAEIVDAPADNAIQAQVGLGGATMTLTILDRQTLVPITPGDPITFNGGAPIDPAAAPDWLLTDHCARLNYNTNEASWKIRMVTDNITDIAGLEYQLVNDGKGRLSSGLIREASDIYNRSRIAWQIYTDATPTDIIDDDHVYGLDLDGEDPVDYDDPGDIAPHWGIISDKGDSSYAGWDADGSGAYDDNTDGYDFNGDGDFLDAQDTDGDGVDDDFEYPPDVEPNPTAHAFSVVYGAGPAGFMMPYPEDNTSVPNEDGADGEVFVYLGADLGKVANGSYASRIYVELYHE
jgi:hypothetical protein